ncbi:RHS repeat-associated core domain-containing protein [Hydrogenophaga borbori]
MAALSTSPTTRSGGWCAAARRRQWEDEETGLYHNDQRYYDPQAGRYLSPDPLGLAGGLNAYAYADNNPLGFADPLGLVLFAFDGTDNTNDEAWLRARGSSLTNVWQFFQLYGGGDRRYIAGVGTLHRDPQYGDIFAPGLDDAVNTTGPARIDRMLQYFNDEADLATRDDEAMEIDIVGFSRGAAQARDFANRIVSATRDGLYRYTVTGSNGAQEARCQKVSFRFMGLFDTVLSTNWGRAYQLGIPAEFSYVAHAVALNEYRGDISHPYGSVGAFPLESILLGMASPAPMKGQTRIERGFIGAHADIGGGFGENENQLAQVALVWMLDQARAAGVNMTDPDELHGIVSNPGIHDKSDSIQTGAPAPGSEDRQVRYLGGARTVQREMPFTEGMSWADTQTFIDYLPTDDPRRRQFVTGTVDMQSYLDWLNANGYGVDMEVR